jgi:hypothetical protein
MKTASPALIAYLNAARASNDAVLIFADAYLFTLQSGATLSYTNLSTTFATGGVTYLGNNVLIDGLKYKASIGLEVDQQQITIASRRTDVIGTGVAT